MTKIKPELISIFQIRVYKSIIDTLSDYLNDPIRPVNFKVGYTQKTSFNFEKQNIRLRLEIILNGVDEKDTEIGIQGDFGIEFHFHVENLNEFFIEKEGSKKISSTLGATLISIAYSTARGIIIERTSGTFLNGIILPVIDPNDFLKNI